MPPARRDHVPAPTVQVHPALAEAGAQLTVVQHRYPVLSTATPLLKDALLGRVQAVPLEPGSGGKESAEGTIKNLAGFSCYADRPTGNKEFRADPWSVQVNNGNVMMMQGLWNLLWIDEHRYFPFGTYKDQVDASAGGFNKLSGKRNVKRVT